MIALRPAALALLLLAAPAAAQETSAPPVGEDSIRPDRPARKPYLDKSASPDGAAILLPPPEAGSPLDGADRAAFTATRALQGSPRWEMATADVAEGASAVLDTFGCVLGTRIDRADVPALIDLLERARLDIARASAGAKVRYKRLRPFVGNESPICVERTQRIAESYSYPSGHATQGWAYALVMAALVPEKATPLLARGRAYGESRVVCGVHWPSDVVAGRTVGAAVFAALVGNAAFRADLERARADLAQALAARRAAPEAGHCAREETALKEPAVQF